ncbi:MAG: HAD family hydrolase [Candidatus Avelusimicrobium sp.]|uniref:HAD family hydrolase n=1 Tax=Candidatus Avelusimicrobium sp. TaxID=3048833 RepID=UPI003F06A6D7
MKIAIFDLDGTLLNTIADLASAANHALEALGFPRRAEEECIQFVGNGVTKLLERALPEGSKTPGQVERMREEFFKYYDEHLWDATFVYPGMTELLDALQARGVMLAVASNKYQSATERLVKHFFPQIQFLDVLGQRDGVPVKPDPDIVYELLLSAGAKKEDVLYVGDSDVDMQTAKNAGVRVCAVTWGFRTRELLETFHPDFITDNPQDILTMI